jgi:acetyl-CoA synthetase (ADP-forming)
MTDISALHTAIRKGPRAVPRISVDRLLHPQSVAVFGASEDIGKFGGRIIHFLTRHGFPGTVYPINLHRAEIAGHKAYPRIADVPKAPDVAILAVPPSRLVASVKEAADVGVGCCVIITTGFAEAASDIGATQQAELVELSVKTGMRIIGPNCLGLIVPHHRMALCSSVVLNTDTLGDGSIGLVSQSAGLMVSVFDRSKTDGIGMRYAISVGNQSDLEICDFLEYMVEDAQTKAICVYIEGVLDPVRFRRAVRACRSADKPLVLIKTGRTEAGVVAAKSHTASLAGSWPVFEAVCRDEGVVLAKDPDDMMRAAHLLASYPGKRPGGRVGVVASAGGAASTASDRVVEVGLQLAPITEDTRAGLRKLLLPPQARNPIDLGGRAVAQDLEIAGDCARVLLSDPNIDYALCFLMSMPFYVRRATAVAEAALASGKPLAIVCTPGAAADAARAELRKLGIVVYDSFEQALRVLCLVADYDRLHANAAALPERPAGLPSRDAMKPLAAGPQTESEVKRLLAQYGISVAREIVASSAEAAGDAAGKLGFPVVVKVISREVVHKSDAGGVRVGLGDRASVISAVREMEQSVLRAVPGARIEGYSVQEMVRGEAEVIVGVRRDEQFGAVVMVGLGGIAVEILNDVAIATAPVSAQRVHQLLATLRTSPLFRGARGRPPLDVDAISGMVERVSWLAADLGSRLIDLEVNPLIVRAEGGGAVAVDARATFATANGSAT